MPTTRMINKENLLLEYVVTPVKRERERGYVRMRGYRLSTNRSTFKIWGGISPPVPSFSPSLTSLSQVSLSEINSAPVMMS